MIVKGNGSIHVVGFYEPDENVDMPFGQEDEEDEEDEENEEELSEQE